MKYKSAYPRIVYVGGIKHDFFTDLFSLYNLCGGNKVNFNFIIGFPRGLVSIPRDKDVADKYAYYKDSYLVTIWIES